MTALTITCETPQVYTERHEKHITVCQHCGNRLGLLRRLVDNRFCDDDHRRAWNLDRFTRALEPTAGQPW